MQPLTWKSSEQYAAMATAAHRSSRWAVCWARQRVSSTGTAATTAHSHSACVHAEPRVCRYKVRRVAVTQVAARLQEF